MKKLNVPLIKQREGSYHCQVATLLMILSYYGENIDYDDLLTELKPYILDDGMHSQGTIIYLRKKGYQTFFGNHDLGVLSPEIEDFTENNLDKFEEFLKEIPNDEKNEYRKEKLELDIAYMKAGGKYSNKLPTLDMLDEYLNKGVPVTLGVRNKGIHLNPVANSGNHSIIVTGKEGGNYLINDPSPKSLGQYSVSRDRLLHAWYNSGVQIKIAWK